MHPEAYAYVARIAQIHGPFGRVLDIGGRDINGSPRRLFDGADYVCVDLLDGAGVDIVADIVEGWDAAPFDLVVCCEVLEHVEVPWTILKAAQGNLGDGGLLILTTACDPRAPHSGRDGGPVAPGEWYLNIDPEEIAIWLKDWDQVAIEVHPGRGDLYATAVSRG